MRAEGRGQMQRRADAHDLGRGQRAVIRQNHGGADELPVDDIGHRGHRENDTHDQQAEEGDALGRPRLDLGRLHHHDQPPGRARDQLGGHEIGAAGDKAAVGGREVQPAGQSGRGAGRGGGDRAAVGGGDEVAGLVHDQNPRLDRGQRRQKPRGMRQKHIRPDDAAELPGHPDRRRMGHHQPGAPGIDIDGRPIGQPVAVLSGQAHGIKVIGEIAGEAWPRIGRVHHPRGRRPGIDRDVTPCLRKEIRPAQPGPRRMGRPGQRKDRPDRRDLLPRRQVQPAGIGQDHPPLGPWVLIGRGPVDLAGIRGKLAALGQALLGQGPHDRGMGVDVGGQLLQDVAAHPLRLAELCQDGGAGALHLAHAQKRQRDQKRHGGQHHQPEEAPPQRAGGIAAHGASPPVRT